MSRIFISYRRADSANAASNLYRHLGMRFGKDLVFQDVDDIRPGDDFMDAIGRELDVCEVFLILIGPHWLVDAQGRRRLDDPQDVLRMEVVRALSREALVIPLLVGGARMPPAAELPEPIRLLARRNAISLSEESWIRDVETLLERLREVLLPRVEDLPLSQAKQELMQMQEQYFGLLPGHAADALELAQKTQAYLDRVLPLYPQDPELKTTRGYLYKNEAIALIYLGRYEESGAALQKGEAVFRTMLEERAEDASAWNGLGSIETVRGNYEEAHVYIDKALKIAPGYAAARHDHELVLQQLGRTSCEGG